MKWGTDALLRVDKITGELYALWDIYAREMTEEQRTRLMQVKLLWRVLSDEVNGVGIECQGSCKGDTCVVCAHCECYHDGDCL